MNITDGAHTRIPDEDDIGCGDCGEPLMNEVGYTGAGAYHRACAVLVYGNKYEDARPELMPRCGSDGGRSIGAGHVCGCVRPAGHAADGERPHCCSCGALWGCADCPEAEWDGCAGCGAYAPLRRPPSLGAMLDADPLVILAGVPNALDEL